MKILVLLTSLFMFAASLPANAAETGSFETSFDKVAPYANMETLAGRMFHGLSFRQLQEDSREDGIDLKKYSVDPRKESWKLYVPSQPAENGKYGILVWMPGEDDFEIPTNWQDALEKRNIILVAPLNADEDRDLVFERSALGLLGMNGVISSYPIDATRLYTGGSGSGALVAEALALSYGDVFSGGFLAGPVALPGSTVMPVPAPGVIENVANRSRFVFLGNSEPGSEDIKQFSTSMLERVCVDEVVSDRLAKKAERPTGQQFSDGLAALDTSVNRDVGECLQRRAREAQSGLEEVRRLAAEKKASKAVQKLVETHEKYGVLIDEEIFAIADQLKEKFNDAYMEYARSIYNPNERLDIVRQQNDVANNRSYQRPNNFTGED